MCACVGKQAWGYKVCIHVWAQVCICRFACGMHVRILCFFYICTHEHVHVCVCTHACMSCQSVSLSLSVCLSVCQCVSQSVSQSASASLSACLSVHLYASCMYMYVGMYVYVYACMMDGRTGGWCITYTYMWKCKLHELHACHTNT